MFQIPDDENDLSPFRIAEAMEQQFAPTALQVAIGEDENRQAELAILLPAATQPDEQGRASVAKMATLAFALQQLSFADLQRAQRLDRFTARPEFDRMLSIVREALGRAPADALRQIAEGEIREEERPPMQFSETDDARRPRVLRVPGGVGPFVKIPERT